MANANSPPRIFFALTFFSTVFSIAILSLSALNASSSIIWISGGTAGLSIVYHGLLGLGWRRSRKAYDEPKLHLAFSKTGVILGAAMFGLWVVAFGVLLEVSGHEGGDLAQVTRRGMWNKSLQIAFSCLVGTQVVLAGLLLSLCSDERSQLLFETKLLEAELRIKTRSPISLLTANSAKAAPYLKQEREASQSFTHISPFSGSLRAPPSAQIKHGAQPGWQFVTPEAAPCSPSSTASSYTLW
ncbi:hypothetical protein B0H34DRAFT_796494 [Crassisporium funariophilum]|nr:hypothetical protein B0H34DRAFT_796494 [Crassisporium funariophilum]